MLPTSRTIAMRQTSKTMRTAVEQADAVVQARRGVQFPEGRGLMDKLNGLNAWCKVTDLRLKSCDLGEGGGRALAEALRLDTTLTSLDLRGNGLGEGGGRALAETLRLNATVTSLDLSYNDLGEGGGRALAEALRLNTTVTSLDLNWNGMTEVRSLLHQAWGDREGHWSWRSFQSVADNRDVRARIHAERWKKCESAGAGRNRSHSLWNTTCRTKSTRSPTTASYMYLS